MRRLIALVGVAMLACAAPAEARTTCRSGKAIYKQRGVRLFVVIIRDTGDTYGRLYICSRKLRRPVRVADSGGIDVERFGVFGRQGNRVVFHDTTCGEEECGSTVGWVDVNSGRTRQDSVGIRYSGPADAVVGRRGEMAVLVSVEEEAFANPGGARDLGYVAHLATRGKRGFAKERALAWTRGYAKRSLAFRGSTVSWRGGGETRAVPLAGERVSCTSGTTRHVQGTTRLFDVVRRKPAASLLLMCEQGATAPVELARSRADYARFRLGPRVGERVPFVLGESGIGTLDAATGKPAYTRLVGLSLVDTALAADGRQAFAGWRIRKGSSNTHAIIGRLEATGWTALASDNGYSPGSLAIDGDVATWKDGTDARRVPLAGEQPVTCASGEALFGDPGGTRVFQAFATAPPAAELYGCLPGGAGPVRLLTAPAETAWKVFDRGTQNGRRLIVASPAREADRGHVVSWTATGDGAVRAGALTGTAYIGDAVVSADGRLAMLRNGAIKYFALAGPGALAPERTLATISSRDGYKAKSLRLNETTVTWKTERGADRSVSL